jgi:hypothetical protein
MQYRFCSLMVLWSLSSVCNPVPCPELVKQEDEKKLLLQKVIRYAITTGSHKPSLPKILDYDNDIPPKKSELVKQEDEKEPSLKEVIQYPIGSQKPKKLVDYGSEHWCP